jgi:hypothetical protein
MLPTTAMILRAGTMLILKAIRARWGTATRAMGTMAMKARKAMRAS